MMKMVFFLGLFLTATIFSFGQGEKAVKEQKSTQKKEQHLKVVVNQNGKEIKIDTTFNLADEKAIQFKVDSILKKYGKEGMPSGHRKVMVLRGGNEMSHESMVDLPGGEHIQIFSSPGDSGKSKQVRKIIRMGKDGEITTIDNFGGDMIPPPPPVPPFHMKSYRISGGDPFSFDPVSYDKKDIGKGLEKITIVRKKSTSSDIKKNVEVKVEITDEKKSTGEKK
jgi:hypothetical protein